MQSIREDYLNDGQHGTHAAPYSHQAGDVGTGSRSRSRDQIAVAISNAGLVRLVRK